MTTPLSIRIYRELRDGPLTDRELAERLCASARHVAQIRLRMLKRRSIRVCGYGPRRARAGHMPHRYTLA